jgi:orotate phosphoribosyltransferase-like protein
MRNDRHLAIKLRKKGLSYNKISKELEIPKSTLHYWFRNLKWSQEIKKELTEKAIRKATKQIRAMARANKERWIKWREMHRKKSQERI